MDPSWSMYAVHSESITSEACIVTKPKSETVQLKSERRSTVWTRPTYPLAIETSNDLVTNFNINDSAHAFFERGEGVGLDDSGTIANLTIVASKRSKK